MYYNYLEYNEANHDKLAKGFDGAREGVIKIKKLGIKVGIVTSKRLLMVQKGINLMNLAGVFDVIVTPEDTAKVKPDPEPVLFGCNALVVEPGETCYVGDSLFDMQAGRLAGTKLCAVKYTLTPYERFSKYSPDYFVDSILEFANILERSCQDEC